MTLTVSITDEVRLTDTFGSPRRVRARTVRFPLHDLMLPRAEHLDCDAPIRGP